MYMNLFDSHVHSDNSHDGNIPSPFCAKMPSKKI